MEERKAEPSSDGFELPVLHLNDHIEESVDIHNMNDLFEKNDKKEQKEEKKEEDKEEKEDKREEGKEEKEDILKKKTLRRSKRKRRIP